MDNGWLWFLFIAASIGLFIWLTDKLSLIQAHSKKAEMSLKQQEIKEHEWEERVKYDKSVIEYLASEKAKGFPWLSKAYDDYFKLRDNNLSTYLETKSHPAYKSAETVRQVTKERREAEKAARETKYLLDYCLFLDPWLEDYVGKEASELDSIIDEIHSAWEKKEEEFEEEVKHHYGPKYVNLTQVEKLQRKLDWWWEKPKKTDWQLGREYERYIGYLYEQNGWNVYYHGSKGFEDLGRDLVCKKGSSVEIVQCKRWAQEKEIHEKHIYYLFGTTVDYYLERFANDKASQLSLFPSLLNSHNVVPKIVTTSSLSRRAEQAADALGVVVEKQLFEIYPSVKCNVSQRTNEKIYHLPFDQQYDTILIEDERSECYVKSVAEAEALGFRHAFRWRGENESNQQG